MANPIEHPSNRVAAVNNPVVIDLGRKRRKLVKKLRRGSGPLMDDVNATLQELQNSGTIAPEAQPVVVIVRERRRSKNRLW